jgi:hypothetical protein
MTAAEVFAVVLSMQLAALRMQALRAKAVRR